MAPPMKTVSAFVYGKEYTLACDIGQEAHLQGLIKQVNSRTERLDKAVGHLPEPLMLLYTALMLADELHDSAKEITKLKADLASAQRMAEAVSDDARLAALEEDIAGNLEGLAERLGALAVKLEGQAAA